MALAATITVDPRRGLTSISPLIYGQFLEHFHRQVFGGAFEPGSPLADGRGFRLDVIEALRDLRVPVVRWPGGCFVVPVSKLVGEFSHQKQVPTVPGLACQVSTPKHRPPSTPPA
jgi:hypothetical protein